MSKPADLLPEIQPVEEIRMVFRRKPLAVNATPIKTKGIVETFYGKLAADPGDWLVTEANRAILVKATDFELLYETHQESQAAVDAGLPDLEPGQRLEHEGRRLIRVSVASGRGSVAFWFKGVPRGEDCEFKVVADMLDNPQASHRVGKFLEPHEGKSGVRTWVVVG